MDKRGQFYLIAAVIIIMILFGLVTVKNNATVQPKPVRFYDLSQDYGAEAAKVIDYGVYNKYSPAVDISERIKNISETFATSAFARDPNVKLVYVYGNNDTVYVGNLTIIGGEIKLCYENSCSAEDVARAGGIHPTAYSNLNTVKVNITGNEYNFDLTQEENFYFVVQTTTPTGEKIVVQKE